jgi:RHS repeat-associated protein
VHLAHPHDGQALRRYLERYEYDAVGNFLKMIHQAANGSWTREYAYEEPSLLEFAKTSNRLSRTSIGATTEPYSHDAHGNMTSMPHLPLMRWDFKDQLRATSQQVVNNGGTPEITYYVYDASGQRVRKVTERQAPAGQTPARMKERIYLGGFEVYREYTGDGQTATLARETLHLMDDKQRIALVETRTQGNEPGVPQQLIRYQFGNHLGSASLELDEQAQIISYEEYYPYGSTSYQAVRSQTETPKRYRYTGKERDEETGLYYHGARYYAAWVGRWVGCDPIGLGGGVNVYQAVSGNPIKLADPTGLDGALPPGELLPGGVGDRTPEQLANGGKPEMERELPEGAKQGEPVIDQVSVQKSEPLPATKEPAKLSAPARSAQKTAAQPEIRQSSEEEIRQQEMDKLLTYELPPEKTGYRGEDFFTYAFVYGLKQTVYNPIKRWVLDERPSYLDSQGHVQTTSWRPDRSGELSVAFGQIALFALPTPKGPALGNRSEELAIDFYNISSPRMQARLSAPNRPITFSTVTREGVTVINVNNPTVYRQFLRAVEEGRIVLQPNEFVGSPPIKSGLVAHPDWSSRYLHAEIQGELELRQVFDLQGPGIASSFPNPGCSWCVPWLRQFGITHMNPSH